MHRDTVSPLDVGARSVAKRIASMMDAAAWRDLLADLADLQSKHPDLPQGNYRFAVACRVPEAIECVGSSAHGHAYDQEPVGADAHRVARSRGEPVQRPACHGDQTASHLGQCMGAVMARSAGAFQGFRPDH